MRCLLTEIYLLDISFVFQKKEGHMKLQLQKLTMNQFKFSERCVNCKHPLQSKKTFLITLKKLLARATARKQKLTMKQTVLYHHPRLVVCLLCYSFKHTSCNVYRKWNNIGNLMTKSHMGVLFLTKVEFEKCCATKYCDKTYIIFNKTNIRY